MCVLPRCQPTPWLLCAMLLWVLITSGCAQDPQPAAPPLSPDSQPGTECGDAPPVRPHPAKRQADEPLDTSALPAPAVSRPATKGRPTSDCYHRPAPAAQGKKAKCRRCEPQSLPFARCRSGINSCCLGHENGPLTWFACERKRGNTSPIPGDGTILILSANNHNMPTGHVAYVEKATAATPPLYRIIFSHTNYDRACSLETDIEAMYNSNTKTLDVLTGAWKDWGKNLPVAGFILR